MSITTPAQEINRDRWGRPLVEPIGGGKPVAYTRCTTFVDCLEDKYNLQKWSQRMVALGLSQRRDLLLAVSAHHDDKRELDKVCEQAREAASASAAATTGTALHALTEAVDRGQDLPLVDDTARADLEAYYAATKKLTAVAIEQFLVQDALQVGGTTDRVVTYQGQRYIADIKTGSIEWGTLKIAMQLALYARSKTYEIGTGVRGEHGADLKRGIIIHLPAGTGTCQLHWVDLEVGWNHVLLARQVRNARKLKMRDLTQPFNIDEPELPTAAAAPSLKEQIKAAATPDAVRALWTPEWTPDLVEAAKVRVAELEKAS